MVIYLSDPEPIPEHLRKIGIVNVKNEKKHIWIIKNRNNFGKYPPPILVEDTIMVMEESMACGGVINGEYCSRHR